jgi:hypothetical protein
MAGKGRFGTVEEVAGVISMLASADSSWLFDRGEWRYDNASLIGLPLHNAEEAKIEVLLNSTCGLHTGPRNVAAGQSKIIPLLKTQHS